MFSALSWLDNNSCSNKQTVFGSLHLKTVSLHFRDILALYYPMNLSWNVVRTNCYHCLELSVLAWWITRTYCFAGSGKSVEQLLSARKDWWWRHSACIDALLRQWTGKPPISDSPWWLYTKRKITHQIRFHIQTEKNLQTFWCYWGFLLNPY